MQNCVCKITNAKLQMQDSLCKNALNKSLNSCIVLIFTLMEESMDKSTVLSRFVEKHGLFFPSAVKWKRGRGFYVEPDGQPIVWIGKNFEAAQTHLAGLAELRQPAFLVNGMGKKIPIAAILPVDVAREQMVANLFEMALKLQEVIVSEKQKMYQLIHDFLENGTGEAGVDIQAIESITFTSYSGDRQIQIRRAERIDYNEQLNQAFRLLNDCLTEWTSGGNHELRALVQQVISAGKKGKIDHAMLLRLQRVNSTHATFLMAQNLIKASIITNMAKQYLSFRQREGIEARWQTVSLNFSQL
jgi:hypothetical protein